MSPKSSPKKSPKTSPSVKITSSESPLDMSLLETHNLNSVLSPSSVKENLDAATLSWLELFKEDKMESGSCVRIFSVTSAKLPNMCGEKAEFLLRVKGQHPSVAFCIDLKERFSKGYVMVTVRGRNDGEVDACARELETLANTVRRDVLDLTKGSSYTPAPQVFVGGATSSSSGTSFLLDMTPALATGEAEAAKDVKLPQKFVGMIIGAGGQTIVKLRKHTGAEIALLQETAAQGYIDYNLHIILLVIFTSACNFMF